MDAERARMQERDSGKAAWAKWGPYLSERQWGTVREDYSADGDAWTYFPHDHARSRAYRWGEDGILGLCDNECRICFAPVFWNGRDAILKERLFGLGNPQGNHGEDVKEAYFYLDNTPSHAWMQALYKYPHAAFPYDQLIAENARRGRDEPEFEIGDTGIFDDSRYFDIFIEYAKAAPEDICIRIRAINRGPEPAGLTVLPTLWFRNTWSWDTDAPAPPELRAAPASAGHAIHAKIPGDLRADGGAEYTLACDAAHEWLFTGNDTNSAKLFNGRNVSHYVKDAFHHCIIEGDREAVNPSHRGTKAAAVLHRMIAPGEEWTINLRLTAGAEVKPASGEDFDRIFAERKVEADAFYAAFAPNAPAEWLAVKRQALAGLLWTKQFYFYNVLRWLKGDPTQPAPPPHRANDRNAFWLTTYAFDIISMPDKWEYPYFCAWDLDFQSVAFAPFDPAFAKEQFHVLRRENYVSASAQTPAYEWNFSDANPPIGAWAAWRIYSIDRARTGTGDIPFLKEAFYRLLLAYGWWANRVDASGDNIFAGGFLGLDNIGVFDRRYPLPDGSVIEQSDGTSWMAAYTLNMLRIALELAQTDKSYVPACDKFLVDFIHLAWVANTVGPNGISLWDHADGFYYDVLRRPDGTSEFLKLRSLTGITPLLAVEALDEDLLENCDFLQRRLEWLRIHRPQFSAALDHLDFTFARGKKLLSLVPEDRVRRILKRLFDENEFLSPHGIRSLSRVYADNPYNFVEGSEHAEVRYSPGDSPVAMFGGNSNWRGPVWMPMNFLLIEALQKYHFYFGDDFTVEFPTGSGNHLNLWQVSLELEKRLIGLFTRGENGRRPCFGDDARYASDPHWQGLAQFFEYYHGDNGRGLGASHQTGWTALVAKMVQQVSSAEKPSAAI
ncbi:MAG: MGH1-like glycoside hydrolase domain-containing protein [Chthoniobacterales bacterium]